MKTNLTREEFTALSCLYDAQQGRTPVFSEYYLNDTAEKKWVLDALTDKGLMDAQFGSITQTGLEALEPYRVERAVILAAGQSPRCVPLSLEIPKGLFEVKGETLIERQIKQLHEAGVRDITLVLGYKKEMFYYLRQELGVRIIENPEYASKSNIQSLLLAKEHLNNAYVCSCDDYFAENPFHSFEYESFYAGIHVDGPTDEMYVYLDEDSRIIKMRTGLSKGLVLLGHSFWRSDFARRFIALAEDAFAAGKRTGDFWEWLVKDHLDEMPPFFFKRYANRAIVEVESFDELRRFDSGYVKHSHSRIVENICRVFRCGEADIVDFRNIFEGMTNRSFLFRVGGREYIYRHPGDGTDQIISRENERTSLEKAREFGIDPTYIYMDTREGWKVSAFVPEFREPDYESPADSRQVVDLLRKLHALPVRLDYGLRPWEDAIVLERLVEEKCPGAFAPFLPLKEKIGALYEKTLGDGVEKCFCHGDTYRHNWMLLPDGGVLLIDWEYAGFADPGIDVGYYIVDAMYDFDRAEEFIRMYLGKNDTPDRRFHFMAYTAIIAYYWFVWSLYRESCGAVIGEAMENWHFMAEKYADHMLCQ